MSKDIKMRRFFLERFEDESGISGTGRVAEGVEYHTGDCVICWLTPTSSINVYRSIKAVKEVHGHGGKTKIRWIDKDNNPPDEEVTDEQV